jgi:hypothetical protein
MNLRIWLSLSMLAALSVPANALACSTLTKEGAKELRKTQERYLRKESDKIIRGTWNSYQPENDPELEGGTRGHIELTKRGKTVRYRVFIRGEINCGFPNYSVEDGAYGLFYLKKDEDPDTDDDADGFVDNFGYVHFKPLKRK